MQNFQLLDICREWLSKRLWISFHFTICTSDIMPLLSPFSMEQQRWIILRYGVCPSVKTIRREFRQKFDVPPFDVPGELAFYKIIKRFNTTNSTVPKSKKEDGGGRPMTGRSPENIDTIRQSITQAGDQSIRVLSVKNDIPPTTVQRILLVIHVVAYAL